jgi:uncharacterized protein (DUF2126 family)
METQPIPIAVAKGIAHDYGYDQIVIIGRKTGDGGCEHVTTYGANKEHCSIAARMGDFLKYTIMGWVKPPQPTESRARRRAGVGERVGHVR